MGLYKKHIADGVNFNYLETGKFKTGFLSVNFIAPLDAATAAKNALIPAILMRGSEQYPNMAEINKKLDYLYASGMSSRNNKRGEMQIFGIGASMLDSAYHRRRGSHLRGDGGAGGHPVPSRHEGRRI